MVFEQNYSTVFAASLNPFVFSVNDNPFCLVYSIVECITLYSILSGKFVPGSICNYGDCQKIQVHLSKAACRVLTIIILL